MPSVKYVIELSNQEKVRLMEIVKKGNSPARTILPGQSCVRTYCLPQTSKVTSI